MDSKAVLMEGVEMGEALSFEVVALFVMLDFEARVGFEAVFLEGVVLDFEIFFFCIGRPKNVD